MTGQDQSEEGPPSGVEGADCRPAPRETGKPDQLKKHLEDAEDRQEALIDEAVEETMDASDPASPKHIT